MELPAKRRRLQSGRACSNCRHSKYRCDGQRPSCSSCRSREITCEYSAASVDLSIEQFESIVASKQKQTGVQESLEQSEVLGRSAAHSRESGEVPSLSQPGYSSPSSPSYGCSSIKSKELGYFGDSSAFKFVSLIQSNLDRPLAPSISRLPSVAKNPACRRSESITEIPHQCTAEVTPAYKFPERGLADELVDSYFDRVHIFYPFIHEGDFRAKYERIWTSTTPPKISEPAWDAILNLIFTHGCEFISIRPYDFFLRASSFEKHARHIILSRIFEKADLSLIQAMLLLCHYLQGTLCLNECWNLVGLMVRAAQSLGLHLDPSKEASFTTTEKEIRKRVWWGCFILDRTLSMKLGRPPFMRLNDTFNVPFPREVDDVYIVDGAALPRQPNRRPSQTSFFVQTIKLAQVIDRILQKMYLDNRGSDTMQAGKRSDSSPASIILGNAIFLDGELQAWWENIPEHLKLDLEPSEKMSFQRQQKVLFLRYLQMRLLLHRPAFTLLAQDGTEDDLLKDVATASSKICISVAHKTIDLIHDQYSRGMLNSVWYIMHYIFASLGVLLTVCKFDHLKLESIEYSSDTSILNKGIDILKESSYSSTLAVRYITLLEDMRPYSDETFNKASAVIAENPIDNPANIPADLYSGDASSNLLGFSKNMELEFMDYLDFLVETSLPG